MARPTLVAKYGFRGVIVRSTLGDFGSFSSRGSDEVEAGKRSFLVLRCLGVRGSGAGPASQLSTHRHTPRQLSHFSAIGGPRRFRNSRCPHRPPQHPASPDGATSPATPHT